MNVKLVESLVQLIRSLPSEEKHLLYKELNIPTQHSSESSPPDSNPYSSQEKQPYRYDDPFEPAVSIEDWEALK
ncbi:MAG: hypothetical protein HC899_36130 [Leptolyngbyaceae cyanobacterium SM1_4_3]|nr:hypothetical protein [Leptolyngbyaceae cyanobacterium SM1_4_3]